MSVNRYELRSGQLRDIQGHLAPEGMYVQAVDFQELASKRRATDKGVLWLQNREIELMGELAELRMKHREIAIGHCNAEAAWILRRNELEAALRKVLIVYGDEHGDGAEGDAIAAVRACFPAK